MAIDDFLKQVEDDELEDRLEEQTLATPIEYARSRSMAPQKVYYYIRHRKLETTHCQCGRRVVRIEEADILFGFKKVVESDQDNEPGSDS